MTTRAVLLPFAIALLVARAVPSQDDAAPRDGATDGDALRAAVQRLGDDDAKVEDAARQELFAASARGAAAVGAFLTARPACDDRHASRCIEVLRVLGPDATIAIDALLAIAAEQRPPWSRLHGQAIAAVGALAPYCPDRLSAIEAALRELAAHETGSDAWRAIGLARIDATVPAERLARDVCSDDPVVRRVQTEAVFERALRGELPTAVVADLVAALHRALRTPLPAATRIRVGDAASPFRVERGEEIARLQRALAVVAPEDPAGVPGHVQLLRDARHAVQARAARSLGLLAAHAAAAVTDLTTVVQLGGPAAREAATALGAIGVADAAVLQTLRRAAASPDAQLAARARAALRRLET